MVWLLQLNDMRSSNIEILSSVCTAQTKEELKQFLLDNAVWHYMDGSWGKVYKKGSILEWFSPPHSGDSTFVDLDRWKADSIEYSVNQIEQEHQRMIMQLPAI